MRLCWKGEGQKYYSEFSGVPHLISLNWWQSPPPIDSRKLIDLHPLSRYLIQSSKNDTAVPGKHRNTVLLNISVKGYTLYAGKEKA